MKNFRHLAVITAATLVALSAPAFAAGPNLVLNGGFETNTGNGEVDVNTTVSNWSVPGATAQKYTFLWNAGAGVSGTTADTTGANGSLGVVRLWGPGTGVANGLTLSPDGGAFIGADGAFQDEPIQQTITGLVAGARYAVTFNWAAAQQAGFDGLTSSGWDVSLGAQTLSTGNLPIGNHGFSGWQTTTFDFIATGASETLSFLSTGTGGAAEPPFSLLDGVSLNSVPEPSTWAMMVLGFIGLGYAGFRKARARSAISSA
jgi:PEP-CTERM motif-containing protein